MRHAARAASAQDHRHGGAVLADGVHARPQTRNSEGVRLGVYAGCYEFILGEALDGK